jgi:hypothetical protein
MKGDPLVVRRFFLLAVSVCLVLAVGIMRVDHLFAQGDAKKETQTTKAEAAGKEAGKADSTKAEPAKKQETSKEATKATEPPLPPIPPEVMAKIEAARKAVAEAIVAAQDAGLVETSIDPPPILDILITGRATDARTLKNPTGKKPYAVSPEVFGAWFTSYGILSGINSEKDVRIINPSAGLKQWYDQRADFLRRYMDEIRKAKGQTTTPKKAAEPPETKKTAPPPKVEELKKK